MKAKVSFQISFIILLIESLVALLYGLTAFILPEILTSLSYPLYTGQTWESLLNNNPEIANYIMIIEGEAGGLGIALILANIFVLFTAFRKRERWAWFFVLTISYTAWGSNLITNILLKNSFSVMIMVIGLILLTVALSVSAKMFLIKDEDFY